MAILRALALLVLRARCSLALGLRPSLGFASLRVGRLASAS
jgi:hypothetical protein